MEAALRRGVTPDALARATGVDPWFVDQLQRITSARQRIEDLASGGEKLESAFDRRTWREVKRLGFSDAQIAYLFEKAAPPKARWGGRRGRGPRRPAPRGGTCDVQDRRHLRCRVRGQHPVPLRDLRGRGRGAPERPAPRRDPRVGAEPHRPGGRVRLLLRARVDGASRGRVRDHHGQLQSRDGLDGLRHLGPPLFRAAHEPRTWRT